ncbi:uncharacterized protein NECHADRAFT_30057 [Fusarium vanettenii 77-13-4]|uniref:Calpain catalytic domain-containing protein n=1 Tax=Fusarium vanettenii (strain ATCC MYA-4622 / CBS 123669 / FGSC 9596 / NRRL 45880 / 77-13-4) TaxID=660122 RepID=C7YW62_FUSV7|nr:uncharacterized protein NECHADRAFT_30057 [Fusarium vanettenii 77-13-4]EEU44118.1 hypothetical protein NECHADRAFT_30057 [Fusarium vanettenii 77-13-4]
MAKSTKSSTKASNEKKTKHQALSPQAVVSKFWDKFNSKAPGKVTSVFPRSLHKSLLADADSSIPKSRNAAQSYEAAAQQCKDRVRAIVKECERTNSKFSDPEFDIDLWRTLSKNSPDPDPDYIPGSVHRIPWIFENPQFTIGGYSGSDIKQGHLGNCWWVAALATIAHRQDLMKKICVEQNEECGVYGFVFFRDGEWIPTVVDDNLYLKEKDYGHTNETYDATGKHERRHKREKQTGSDSLAFAKCEDANETWFPLLEKAFAKVHGDYEALEGGWSCLAVEDLTGGVATMMQANSVLRKDRLWREMLVSDTEDSEFVFSLSAMRPGTDCNNGIVQCHAYSVLKATEVEDERGEKVRLVKIRNPWGGRNYRGQGAWHGPWSDGSKEWTSHMIQKLRYRFGDDGSWWMSYNDMLDNFVWIHRTRVFDKRWTVAQQWTSVNVPWLSGYLKKKFIIEVKEEGIVVITLSQLDKRYFNGLEGQYRFVLQFLLKSVHDATPICQTRATPRASARSTNCEVELEPGTYEVIPKIVAQHAEFRPTVQKVVKIAADKKPRKLQQVGLLHDLAHAKGGIVDEDEAIRKKRENDKKEKLESSRKQEIARKEEKEKDDARRKIEEALVLKKTEYYSCMSEKTKGVESNDDAILEKVSGGSGKDPVEDQAKSETPTGSDKETWENVEEKKEGESRRPSQDSNSPLMERSATSQSTESKLVSTPSTEGHSEEANSSDSSDTESECEPGSDDDDSEQGDSNDSSVRKQRKKQPWNPVCVIGLRVYAQHAGISVRLAEQKTDDVAESLPAKDDSTKSTS